MKRCDDCVGGWRYVQEAYAVQIAATKGEPESDAYKAALSAARNTVYPCRTCQPDRYYRWADHHLDGNHDRSACVECIQAGAAGAPGNRKPPPRRASTGSHEPPPPTDRDYPDHASAAAGDR